MQAKYVAALALLFCFATALPVSHHAQANTQQLIDYKKLGAFGDLPHHLVDYVKQYNNVEDGNSFSQSNKILHEISKQNPYRNTLLTPIVDDSEHTDDSHQSESDASIDDEDMDVDHNFDVDSLTRDMSQLSVKRTL